MKKLLLLMLLVCVVGSAQNPETPKFPGEVATDKTLFVAANSATATLSAAITTTSQTALATSSTAAFIVPTVVKVDNEIVAICSKGANLLTACTVAADGYDGRGFSGTVAATHLNGSTLTGIVDRGFHNRGMAEIMAIEAALGVSLANVQASDADLTDIAALACTENQIQKKNGAGVWACAADADSGGANAVTQAVENSVDNTLSKGVGATGRAFEKTGVTVDDSDNISTPGTLTLGVGGTTPWNQTGYTDDAAPSAPGAANQFTQFFDRTSGLPSWLLYGGTQEYAALGDSAGSAAKLPVALTGVVKVSSGVPAVVTGTASDCVLVDGSSGACGSGSSDLYTVVTDATTTRTLAAGDCASVIQFTSGSAVTVTVPTGLGAGCNMVGSQSGAGVVSFTADGTTLRQLNGAAATAGQHSKVFLYATTDSLWELGGQVAGQKVAAATVADSATGNAGGTAAGLTAQYVDWSAGSGGASIANKPSLGTASAATLGTGAGQVPVTGEYQPSDADLAAIAALTCTENQIQKKNGAGVWACATDATAGAPTFDGVGGGTNTTAAMVVSTGASLAASGSGTIAATSVPGTGVPFTQTGTGAVARTVDAKLKDSVSVKDFGASGSATTTTTSGTTAVGTSVTLTSASTFAVGQGLTIAGAGTGGALYVGEITVLNGAVATISPATGTQVNAGAAVKHDDTAALVAALAAHYHVKAPAGTYNLTSVITMDNGNILSGDGGGMPGVNLTTQFVAPFAGPVFSVPTPDINGVTFRGFSLSCSSTASSIGFQVGGTNNAQWATAVLLDDVYVHHCGDNILVQNAWDVRFKRLGSTDALRYGVYLHPPSGGYTTTVSFADMTRISGNGAVGLFTDGDNRSIVISNSDLEGNTSYDADFTGTANSLSIVTSWFERASGTTIHMAAGFSSNISVVGSNINGAVQWGGNLVTNVGTYGLPYQFHLQNLLLQSQSLGTTPWAAQNQPLTFTNNNAVAPDGTTTATKIIANSTDSDVYYFGQGATPVSVGQDYTFSIYVKMAVTTKRVLIREGAATGDIAVFDINAGTLIATTSGVVGTITPQASAGWYRISMTETYPGLGTNPDFNVYLVSDTCTSFATAPYAPTVGDGFYFWGAQVNAGVTAQPYMKTTTTVIP